MIIRFIKGLIKLVLYIAFVVAAVYYTPKILVRVLHTDYPLATITSGSMWPSLKQNDLVLMKGASGAEVEIGQIIIYRNAKGFTIHRLVRRMAAADGGASKLITKGDANNVEDSPIEESAVIGRVVYIRDKPFRIPNAGLVARSLGPRIKEFQKSQ